MSLPQSFRVVGFAAIVMGTASYCRIIEDTEHPAKESALFFRKTVYYCYFGWKSGVIQPMHLRKTTLTI